MDLPRRATPRCPRSCRTSSSTFRCSGSGPAEWVYAECRDIGAMSFRFKEPEEPIDAACGLASSLQLYPPAEVLCAPCLFRAFDAPAISRLLALLTPERASVVHVSERHTAKADCREEWYGTAFACEPPSAEELAAWRGAAAEIDAALALPQPNPFIPTEFASRATPLPPPPTTLPPTTRRRRRRRRVPSAAARRRVAALPAQDRRHLPPAEGERVHRPARAGGVPLAARRRAHADLLEAARRRAHRVLVPRRVCRPPLPCTTAAPACASSSPATTTSCPCCPRGARQARARRPHGRALRRAEGHRGARVRQLLEGAAASTRWRGVAPARARDGTWRLFEYTRVRATHEAYASFVRTQLLEMVHLQASAATSAPPTRTWFADALAALPAAARPLRRAAAAGAPRARAARGVGGRAALAPVDGAAAAEAALERRRVELGGRGLPPGGGRRAPAHDGVGIGRAGADEAGVPPAAHGGAAGLHRLLGRAPRPRRRRLPRARAVVGEGRGRARRRIECFLGTVGGCSTRWATTSSGTTRRR